MKFEIIKTNIKQDLTTQKIIKELDSLYEDLIY